MTEGTSERQVTTQSDLSELHRDGPSMSDHPSSSFYQPCLEAGQRPVSHLFGHELLTRRCELVALTTNDLESLADGTMRVIIRRSKADPFRLGRVAFTPKSTADAVKEWLTWRRPEINFLFCPIYRGKAVNRDLSTTTVKRLVKSAAKAAGLDSEEIDAFSEHSLRVGAAQDLLCAGYDAAAIIRAGGWKSVNILGRYLEMTEHNVWT